MLPKCSVESDPSARCKHRVNSPDNFTSPRRALQAALPHGAMGRVAQATGRAYAGVTKMFEGLVPMSLDVFRSGLTELHPLGCASVLRAFQCPGLLVTTALPSSAPLDERQAVLDNAITSLWRLRELV